MKKEMTLKDKLEYLLKNKKGFYKRVALARHLNIIDCTLRDLIKELRKEGKPIVNFQDGEGYKWGTKAEVSRYLAQETRRLKDETETLQAMAIGKPLKKKNKKGA